MKTYIKQQLNSDYSILVRIKFIFKTLFLYILLGLMITSCKTPCKNKRLSNNELLDEFCNLLEREDDINAKDSLRLIQLLEKIECMPLQMIQIFEKNYNLNLLNVLIKNDEYCLKALTLDYDSSPLYKYLSPLPTEREKSLKLLNRYKQDSKNIVLRQLIWRKIDNNIEYHYTTHPRIISFIKALHTKGYNIDSIIGYSHETPFMIACKEKRMDISELLLQLGANINYEDPNGNTALLNAVSISHYGLVDFLLDNNAKTESSKYSSLVYAIYNNDTFLIRRLIKAGASLDFKHAGIGTPKQILDDNYKKLKDALNYKP